MNMVLLPLPKRVRKRGGCLCGLSFCLGLGNRQFELGGPWT